jgi:hypothetical protein
MGTPLLASQSRSVWSLLPETTRMLPGAEGHTTPPRPPLRHWEYIPLLQKLHRPQEVIQEMRTLSPLWKLRTFVPSSSTIPIADTEVGKQSFVRYTLKLQADTMSLVPID